MARTAPRRAAQSTATQPYSSPGEVPALSDTQSATPTADDALRELAAELVAEKETRQPIEVVVRILAARDSGDPVNRIPKNVGVHHSVVSRVIDAAADHRQRVLAAV